MAVSGFTTVAIGSYWNGASGSNMVPLIGINTKRYPSRYIDDVRFQKQISFNKSRNLQLMCNIFNIANHQNITGVNNTAYTISGTTVTYNSATYGTITHSNNQGFLYAPRQIEFAARINF